MSSTTEHYSEYPTEDTTDGTHVTVDTDTSDQQRTTINDHKVRYWERGRKDTTVKGTWPVEADEHVRSLIEQAETQRQAIEDRRANHRNLNRMLTLLGALLIGIVVTYVLDHNGIPHVVTLPHWCTMLAPYAFVITILLDSSLALYSLIRHY